MLLYIMCLLIITTYYAKNLVNTLFQLCMMRIANESRAEFDLHSVSLRCCEMMAQFEEDMFLFNPFSRSTDLRWV
jgi:hypothetical protein